MMSHKCFVSEWKWLPICSSVVTMSRECRTIGQWSSVDFSSCTLQSANEPPFLLIWLLLSAFFVVPSADQFATEVSLCRAWCTHNYTQVAELASLAQLLPPCSPTCVIRRQTALCQSCYLPLVSASAATTRLRRPVSTAPRLRPLRLLLLDYIRLNCCSGSASRLIASASAVAPRLRPLQLLLRLHLQLKPRLRPFWRLLTDIASVSCSRSFHTQCSQTFFAEFEDHWYEGRTSLV